MTEEASKMLKYLDEHLTKEEPQVEKLITSGRHYQGWVRERIKIRQQILINAFRCPAGNAGFNLEWIKAQIIGEFAGIHDIYPIPLPVTGDKILETVKDLIGHFGSSISPDDVIQDFKDNPNPRTEMEGYVIITIINIPVIV